MKEVFFSDYLRKKAKKSLVACVAGAVVALILLLAGIVTGVGFILVSGVVAIVIALFVAATHGPSYATHRCGIRSEQVLRAHLLSKGLRDDYTAYYNLPLNGRSCDIDCILVGPSGLFVFEAKHHHGLILYRNGIWARIKVGRRGTPYLAQLGNPSGQLSRNIRKLKELLEQACLCGLWLHGAVVFTNPRAVLDIEGLRWVRAIAVKDLGQILTEKTVLSADQIDRINTCSPHSQGNT